MLADIKGPHLDFFLGETAFHTALCTTQVEKEFVKRKRLAKEIEMTLARAQSLPVKYSVVKMILVTSLEFP